VPNSGGGGNPAQAAREKADAFKTIHTGVLDKTINDITAGDEAAVIEALAAYEALGDEEKALLSGEKTLLDSLKARIGALKGKDAFAGDHDAVLDKTPATVTADDEAAVDAALAAYEALGTVEKALLKDEKDLLDSLKARIDELTDDDSTDDDSTDDNSTDDDSTDDDSTDDDPAQTAANAFKTAHAGVLTKTTAAVTVADESAVNAALTAYNALSEDAKALLGTQKTLLDNLKTKIEQLKSPGTGKFTFTVWADDDDERLLSDFPDDTTILKSEQGSLTITAAEDLTNIQWSLNGVNIPAPRGTGQTISFQAVSYVPGIYTLGLYATKEENGVPVPYSINITFIVDN
jgi:hypothetical protein